MSCAVVTSPITQTSRNAGGPHCRSYEDRGGSGKEAERPAWATVNKDDGGGKEAGGSGQGKHTSRRPQSRRERRQSSSVAIGRRPFGFGKEGGGDAEAERRAPRSSLMNHMIMRGVTSVAMPSNTIRGPSQETAHMAAQPGPGHTKRGRASPTGNCAF